jgi:hypothetical protein
MHRLSFPVPAGAYFINQQLNVKVPETENSTTGFARMDYRAGDKNTFTLSGAILAARGNNNLNNATVSTNGGLLGANANLTNSTRYAAFGWTHVIGESMVNNFHGGWFRDTMTTATNTSQFPVSSSPCQSCGTGPLAINVDGASLGGNPTVPFNLREGRYQVADDFSFTLGVAHHPHWRRCLAARRHHGSALRALRRVQLRFLLRDSPPISAPTSALSRITPRSIRRSATPSSTLPTGLSALSRRTPGK